MVHKTGMAQIISQFAKVSRGNYLIYYLKNIWEEIERNLPEFNILDKIVL